MLNDLLKELQNIRKEVDNLNIDQLPEDQRVAAISALADKVLNTLDNANIEIPDEHSDDSGIEVPTSEL
jgi:predicted  nucleic acid-binding Zn-ribbon protein